MNAAPAGCRKPNDVCVANLTAIESVCQSDRVFGATVLDPSTSGSGVVSSSVHFGVKLPIFRTTVVLLQHFNNFERKPHCRADCLVCYSAHSTQGACHEHRWSDID
jgi:hypothetical protein